MNLKHAIESVSLADNTRAALREMKDEGTQDPVSLAELAIQIEELIERTPQDSRLREWIVMSTGLRVLASQMALMEIARDNSEGDMSVEHTRYRLLSGELKLLLSSESHVLPQHAEPFLASVHEAEEYDTMPLCSLLSEIPLPTLYWYQEDIAAPVREAFRTPEPASSPMARVSMSLDRTPIVSPQILSPNVNYTLDFHVRGLVWPEDAVRLKLSFSTTYPDSEFTASDFYVDRPNSLGVAEYEGEVSGYIGFKSALSNVLDDVRLRVHGAFETSEGQLSEVPIIGHDELCVSIVDQVGRQPWTGNRPLDRHIFRLVKDMLSDYPSVRDELPELLDILPALGSLLSTYAQEAIYKGQNDLEEGSFQKQVIRDLRLRLGQDVQEHPAQAGGITDIRYRGVVIELKVERQDGDRNRMASKYVEQVAQYTGVEARQVSVSLVLDMTPKDKPPGDIRNDILLVDVDTHGGSNEEKQYPSKAFVFVVNGNTKNPSEYS